MDDRITKIARVLAEMRPSNECLGSNGELPCALCHVVAASESYPHSHSGCFYWAQRIVDVLESGG